jgi:hypothetical protein
MRRFWPMLILALCLVLVLGLLELRRAPAATGPATVRVVTRQMQSAVVNVGARGRGTGDVQLTSALIYNTRVTPKSIGRFEEMCTFVRRGSRICRGTISLPRGDIVVGGSVRFMRLYELGVLGGTGLYDNARGTLTVTLLDSKPTRQLLLVRLIG